MLLKDRVAVVTGGSRGIGKEIALTFAAEGARVALCGRSAADLEKVKSEIESNGASCIVLQADVSQSGEAERVVQKTLDTWGIVDILVNNAGVTKDNLIARLSEEDWDFVLAVNLKGVFLFTKAVSKPMIKQRRGKIINVTSVIGLTGNAGQANYAASKAGIIGFTKSVAKELGRRNICVNALAPGYIETDMTGKIPEETKTAILNGIPLGRLGCPKDVARAALFLASDDSNYITGQVIVVDGGMVM
jgi:3-oxoacyl-[acyl-carrier protein] reductase